MKRCLWFLLTFVCAVPFPNVSRAGELNVSAAASLTDALHEIASAYETVSGDRVLVQFGASSTLARQIEEGAPVDVFVSADEAKMDRLETKGLIVAGSRRNLLSNTLVVVVPSDSALRLDSPRQLAGDAVQKLALADPKAVPAGVYAKEYLVKLGLWQKIESRVIPTENVRAALAAVASGNVDAGIVYKTDAAISPKVRIAYEVPAADGPKIRYPCAVVAGSQNAAAARRFVAYLQSADAGAVFKKYGFLLLK